MSSLSYGEDCSDYATIISKLKGTEETVKSNGVAVRFRPVIRSVLRKHAFAYAISILQKHCFACTNFIGSPLTTSSEAVASLLKELKKTAVETFDFAHLQTVSLASLNRYLDSLLTNRSASALPWLHVWQSLSLRVDVTSLVNRRRRQEDRWFAVADVLHYINTDISESGSRSNADEDGSPCTRPPCISAFGIFDGHGGPEAAEHCSHLAPYLLCTGLRERLRRLTPPDRAADLQSEICFTDLLADVFSQLNQSVDEGRLKKMWNSGTTGTICLLVKDTVYTAWVGDSQCWLYYSGEEVNSDCPKDAGSRSSLLNPVQATEQQAVDSGAAVNRSHIIPVPMTDRIHRPEFAPEFVSVMRAGGSVSMHLSREPGTSEERVLAFTGLDVPASGRTSAAQYLGLSTLPPLASPYLSDCRVDAVSSVSRGIGDSRKVPSISALPSATVHRLRQHQKALCLVLATDGLWDNDGCSGPDLTQVLSDWSVTTGDSPSKQLSQLAIDKGASDNVTCLVVQFDKPRYQLGSHSHGPCNVCVKTRWPLGVRFASAPDNLNDYYAVGVQIRGPRSSHPRRGREVSRSHSHAGESQLSRATVRLSSPPR